MKIIKYNQITNKESLISKSLHVTLVILLKKYVRSVLVEKYGFIFECIKKIKLQKQKK